MKQESPCSPLENPLEALIIPFPDSSPLCREAAVSGGAQTSVSVCVSPTCGSESVAAALIYHGDPLFHL